MWFFLFVLVTVAVVIALIKSKNVPSEATPGGRRPPDGLLLPDSLPVAVKRHFFSRSESAFYSSLSAALEGTPYTVFPNVRLNDLFTITDPQQRQSTYNRLRDKHVDFLIVTREGAAPRLAIELDGASHDNETQKKRDQVKDLVFRSRYSDPAAP